MQNGVKKKRFYTNLHCLVWENDGEKKYELNVRKITSTLCLKSTSWQNKCMYVGEKSLVCVHHTGTT